MSEPIESTREQSPEDIRHPPSVPRPGFAAGETVPGLSSWVLERKLGGGGFGEVWLAGHVWNNKEKSRAVKFCLDPATRNRLVAHERNVVVRVMKYAGDHPHIVPLLDCNLDGDIPWLMYEFVEGGTLANLIDEWRKVPLSKRLHDVLRTLHAIAGALAACHRLDPPLVHRDMKPQNVLMAGAVPRITDFGIGSVVVQPKSAATGAVTARAAELPTALHSAGTRLYAPAEQLFGSPPDPRDDVYALGIIAYQMLTGDLTIAPGSDPNLAANTLHLPGELTALIFRSTALDPNGRPKDASEWEATLAAMLQKSHPHPELRKTVEIGSIVMQLPGPSPTAVPPAHTDPVPVRPPLPAELPPEPRPVAGAARGDRGSQKPAKRFVAILVGSVLALGLVVGIAMSFLPSGKQSEASKPADRVEQPSEEPSGPKKGETRDPGSGPVPKKVPGPGSGPAPGKTPDPDPGPGPMLATAPDPRPVLVKVPKAGENSRIEVAPGVWMTFCWVPAGECQLGSPKAEQDDITKKYAGQRPVYLDSESEAARGKYKTAGFWMGKYEVTQAEWKAVMGTNPSNFDGTRNNKAMGMDTGRFPVESVSWDDICGKDGKGGEDSFLGKVNAYGGIRNAFGKPGRFALPHEDEWEYACRGGKHNIWPFYSGDTLTGTETNFDGELPYGTTVKVKSLERTCEVDFTNDGSYAKHPWGLMHMQGNVWEWCENTHNKTNSRIVRGGSWNSPGLNCRAAVRISYAPETALGALGFRLVIRLG